MAIITTYTDDSATTDDDKFLTVDSSGATKLTPASTLGTYMSSEITGIATEQIADDAVTPAKRSGGFYSGTISLSAGTGSKSVTGFGFEPKKVEFFPNVSHASAAIISRGYAWNNGGSIVMGFQASSGTTSAVRTINGTTASLVIADPSSGNLYVATVTAFGSDGITINVTTDNASYRNWHVIAEA